MEDDEELDAAVDDLTVTMTPAPGVSAPPPPADLLPLDWVHHPSCCHIEGVRVTDGERTLGGALPPWPFYAARAWSPDGTTLLLSGPADAFVIRRAEGAVDSLFHDEQSDGVSVAWLGDEPLAAGATKIVIGAVELPCNLPTLARRLAGGALVVINDNDGLQLIGRDGAGRPRVVARSWRSVNDAFDDADGVPHVLTADGTVWRLSVRPR